MNSKRLTVMIGEREALPVRAIPYATDWNSFTPDMLAWYLGEDDERFSDDVMPLMPLRAYRMEDGQPAPIEPSAWAGVADALKNTDDESRIGHISCLPPSVFVWLDDFRRVWRERCKREFVVPFEQVPGFKQQWREKFGEEFPDETTDGERIPADVGDELSMSPTLLDGATTQILMEGFETYSDLEKGVGAGGTATNSRTPARIDAIVDTARQLGYDPMSVPYGGKAAIERECLANMISEPHRFTADTFKATWQAARDAKRIDVENAEIYRGQ